MDSGPGVWEATEGEEGEWELGWLVDLKGVRVDEVSVVGVGDADERA